MAKQEAVNIIFAAAIFCFLASPQIASAEDQYFDQEPSDTDVILGNTAILSCQVANRQGRVTWTRGGFGLGFERNLPAYPRISMIGHDDIGSYHLFIERAQLSDDEAYQCQVTATATTPRLISRSAKLNVIVPPENPTIVNQPSIAVLLNQAVNVTCQANGSKPAPTFTWYKNHVLITPNHVHTTSRRRNGSKLFDATSQVTIRATSSDSGNKIECRVANEALTEPLRATAILDVQYKPNVAMFPNKTTYMEYQTLHLTCEGLANPFQTSWVWLRNGVVIPGHTRNEYKIERLSWEDNGLTIACSGTNAIGTTTISKILNIEYGPRFEGVAEHARVSVGDDATLTCKADGNPKPGIHWTRRRSNDIINNLPSLVIRKVHKRQFGVYVCTAIVLGFNEISRDIYLLENGPPEITRVSEQRAYKGDTARLTCTAQSVPQPGSMIWSRDGKPLDIQTSSKYSLSVVTVPYGQTSILKIMNLHEDDFGGYNCSVVNTYGSDMITINLIEKDVFPLAYVVGGAVGGVAVIFVLVIGCVIYQRHKGAELESSTDSESSLERKQQDNHIHTTDYGYPDTLNEQWRQRTKAGQFTDFTSGEFRHVEELNDCHVNNNGYLPNDVQMYSRHPDILANNHHTLPNPHIPPEYTVTPHYLDNGTLPNTTFRQTPVSNHSSDTYSRLPAADPATARYGTNV